MASSRERIYAWSREAFGAAPFRTRDFAEVFRSPDARKILSDLQRSGYIERIGRGAYRTIPAEERFRRIVEDRPVRLDLPEAGNLPYAYSDATAVAIWTDGAYWTGFTKAIRPLHMKVRNDHLGRWRRYTRSNGYDSVTPEERKTIFGTVFVLHPANKFDSTRHMGVSVVPLKEARAYAEGHPHAFGPILPDLAELTGSETP